MKLAYIFIDREIDGWIIGWVLNVWSYVRWINRQCNEQTSTPYTYYVFIIQAVLKLQKACPIINNSTSTDPPQCETKEDLPNLPGESPITRLRNQ